MDDRSIPGQEVERPAAATPISVAIGRSQGVLPGLRAAVDAIERGEFDLAARRLSGLPASAQLAAEVHSADIVVRSGVYDDHYDLVFRLARTHRLGETDRCMLAVQTAELAVLAANENLARRLFRFAEDRAHKNPLYRSRARVGRGLVDLLTGPDHRLTTGAATTGRRATSQDAVLVRICDHLNPSNDPRGLGLQRVAASLYEVGLVDFARRALAVRSAWMTGEVDPTIDPIDIARCPWVTSSMLQRRVERCEDDDFDYWATVMELRLAHGPHASLVNETGDVIAWSSEIHDQHLDNVRLTTEVEQAQAGWRELANLTSNEIRGLLTSLEVITDLRRVGDRPPPGLELALVHRVAALTTMTQVGASDTPNEREWPVVPATPAGPLLSMVIEGSRPMFDWTGRTLRLSRNVGDDTVIDVHPGLFSDMLRWLLISVTTGSLRDATIEVSATTDEGRFAVAILARTPAAPLPEYGRELGLAHDSTAYRAAVAILESWGGTFDAVYSANGLDVFIDLPATCGQVGELRTA